MTKSDDSSLDPDDLRTVEERARQLLDRADAWDRYPVPTNDILAAAKVQVAPTSAFDPNAILAYIVDKAVSKGQDCKKTLAPEIADQFEREANNFARFALFKGNTFAEHAADCALEIKTPIKLAKKFGASLYASVREFARTPSCAKTRLF